MIVCLILKEKKRKKTYEKQFFTSPTGEITTRTLTHYEPSEYELNERKNKQIKEIEAISEKYGLNENIKKVLCNDADGDMATRLSNFYAFKKRFDGSIFNKYTMDKWHYIFDFYKIIDIFNETFSDFIDMCENGDKDYYERVKRLLTATKFLEGSGFESYMSLEQFNAIYPEITKEIGKPILLSSNRFFTLVSKKINKEHIAIYELLITEHSKTMLYNN